MQMRIKGQTWETFPLYRSQEFLHTQGGCVTAIFKLGGMQQECTLSPGEMTEITVAGFLLAVHYL